MFGVLLSLLQPSCMACKCCHALTCMLEAQTLFAGNKCFMLMAVGTSWQVCMACLLMHMLAAAQQTQIKTVATAVLTKGSPYL